MKINLRTVFHPETILEFLLHNCYSRRAKILFECDCRESELKYIGCEIEDWRKKLIENMRKENKSVLLIENDYWNSSRRAFSAARAAVREYVDFISKDLEIGSEWVRKREEARKKEYNRQINNLCNYIEREKI